MLAGGQTQRFGLSRLLFPQSRPGDAGPWGDGGGGGAGVSEVLLQTEVVVMARLEV